MLSGSRTSCWPAPIGTPGGDASRTSRAEIGDELPNVREILERVGEEVLQ